MSQTSRIVNKSTISRTVNERKTSKKTQDAEKTKKSTIAPTPDKKKLITKKSDSALITSQTKPASVPLKRKSIPATVYSKTLRGAPVKPIAKVPVKAVKPNVSKGNVMNTIHNVTVASPPTSANKDRTVHNEENDVDEIPKSAGKTRERTLTRTLDDDEILVLRNLQQPDVTLVTDVKPKIPIKEPVAFEVNFEDKKKVRPQLVSTPAVDEDDYDYASDFESYESDFESEIDETDNSIKSNEATEGSKSITEQDESSEAHESTEENSYHDQPQIQEKPENNLDSGNYDLTNSKKSTVTPTPQLDSIDEFTVISHDSGISYDEEKKLRIAAFNKRGEELMKKITLDEMTFNLFEVPPIPYDVYMQLYGQNDTQQISTQTDVLTSVEATQTDDISFASIWTQFPPSFSKQGLNISSNLYNEEKNGVGVGFEDALVSEAKNDEMESITQALEHINGFTEKNYLTKIAQPEPNIQNLNIFLRNASLTISNILNKRGKADTLKKSQISISQGYFTLNYLDIEVLKNTKVTKLYTNLEINNILLTVHNDAESSRNLICLWNILYAESPLNIMSSWSDISCLEVHYQLPEVVLMGSCDGSISLWDTNESVNWQERVNGYAFLTPCQIVFSNAHKCPDASIAALKSLPNKTLQGSFNSNQSFQICSLNENGLMTVYTIVRKQTQEASDDISILTPFSRIKLIRNLTIDLNNTLGQTLKAQSDKRKSSFDKTRYYFESDIFSDNVLKELQQLDSEKTNGRDESINFSCLDISTNEYFVATDSNFVTVVSNFDQQASSRKICVDKGNILHPTALKLHPNDKNVLAVGLSNGNLFFFSNKKRSPDDSDSDDKPNRLKVKENVANMVSKSCAIQSIIENEKKVYDENQALNNLEMDELKAFLLNEALAEQSDEIKSNEDHADYLKALFNRNIFNNFGVNGRAVQMIEFNKCGEFLFVLAGKKVKIFSCLAGKMVEIVENYEVKDMKCVSNYLILLTADEQIVINKLKN